MGTSTICKRTKKETKTVKNVFFPLPLLGVILQYTTTKDWFAFDLAGTSQTPATAAPSLHGFVPINLQGQRQQYWTASLVNSINRSQFRCK
jgi:hypothetical protein